MPRDNRLDVIRIIAMAMIVSCHYFQIIGWAEIAFWLNGGVQIFFAISAYLLSVYTFENNMDIVMFLKKRFMRIMIPVWIYLISIIGILLIAHLPVKPMSVVMYMLGLTAFSKEGLLGLGHLWYITAILICYSVVPILNRILKNEVMKPIRLMIISLILVICMMIFYRYSYMAYGIDIAFFVVMYCLFQRYRTQRHERTLLFCFVPVAVILTALRIIVEGNSNISITGNVVLNDCVITLDKCCLAVVVFCLIHSFLKAEKRKQIITFLSGISYEVYLTHQFVLLVANRVFFILKVNIIIRSIMIIVVSLPIIVVWAMALKFLSKQVEKMVMKRGEDRKI